jgi:hypothetical protein
MNPLDVLTPPPTEEEQRIYYNETLKMQGMIGRVSIGKSTVCDGKGVFAEKDFRLNEVIFREKPLASIQDTINKVKIITLKPLHTLNSYR